MERIVQIEEVKIQEIRGYMANSTKTCATGTCMGCGGCHRYEITDAVERLFKDIPESFYQ